MEIHDTTISYNYLLNKLSTFLVLNNNNYMLYTDDTLEYVMFLLNNDNLSNKIKTKELSNNPIVYLSDFHNIISEYYVYCIKYNIPKIFESFDLSYPIQFYIDLLEFECDKISSIEKHGKIYNSTNSNHNHLFKECKCDIKTHIDNLFIYNSIDGRFHMAIFHIIGELWYREFSKEEIKDIIFYIFEKTEKSIHIDWFSSFRDAKIYSLKKTHRENESSN